MKDNVIYSIVTDDKVFQKIQSGERNWAVLTEGEPSVMRKIKKGAELLMTTKEEKKFLSAKIEQSEKIEVYRRPAYVVHFGIVKEVKDGQEKD